MHKLTSQTFRHTLLAAAVASAVPLSAAAGALDGGIAPATSNAISIGSNALTTAPNAIAIGAGEMATVDLDGVGILDTASGGAASARALRGSGTAIGQDSLAAGIGSTAVGVSAHARGFSSTALGIANKAYGDFASALGVGNRAKYAQDSAIGFANRAAGGNSLALGSRAVVNDFSLNSIAIGTGGLPASPPPRAR